ncbi:hypothetical protein [Asticcacaulis sp. YBE204]|uniref:hypothetical protein n=1 Tax=Asticcacaulis sp. YBE204 TaxID=1282363 RepID=UPI0003C3C8F9|nr:hypothetical protein [Asticcacaulis sp. YBE204]ESQ79598.1 hypothetical protein AEYBE204_07080 [Asticcacaulis sp. YBE204]
MNTALADRFAYPSGLVEKAGLAVTSLISGVAHVWGLSLLPIATLTVMENLPSNDECLCDMNKGPITVQIYDTPVKSGPAMAHLPPPLKAYTMPWTPPKAFVHYPTASEATAILGRTVKPTDAAVTIVCAITPGRRLTTCKADDETALGAATERLFETHAHLRRLPLADRDKVRVRYEWNPSPPVIGVEVVEPDPNFSNWSRF